MTDAELKELATFSVVHRHHSAQFVRQGEYAQAAEVLEGWLPKYRDRVKGLSEAELRHHHQWGGDKALENEIAQLRQRARWSAEAAENPHAARQLLKAMLDETLYLDEGIRYTQTDEPRVQRLLEALRRNDEKARTLLQPRKVKVVLLHSVNLTVEQQKKYVSGVVASLKHLGLAASSSEGDEPFELRAEYYEESAHYIGDDVCQCELLASARWAAAGLEKIDLEETGVGDESIADDCIDCILADGGRFAGRQVLRAAFAL